MEFNPPIQFGTDECFHWQFRLWKIEKMFLFQNICCIKLQKINNPAEIYLFNVKNRNTRTMCKICSKLTIKTPIKSLLLTLNRFHSFLCCLYCWLWTSTCWLGYLEKINFVKIYLAEDNIASNRKRKKEIDAISSLDADIQRLW